MLLPGVNGACEINISDLLDGGKMMNVTLTFTLKLFCLQPRCVCMCNQVGVVRQCRSKTLIQTATVAATTKKWR